MMHVDKSCYGVHTITEIYEMFEKSNAEQANIIKITGKYYEQEFQQIAYFTKKQSNQNPSSYSLPSEEKFNVYDFQVYKNTLGQDSTLNIFVKDIEKRPDYIRLYDLYKKYCSMDNVDHLILHDQYDDHFSNVIASLFGEAGFQMYDTYQYNHDMLEYLKRQHKYLIVDIPNTIRKSEWYTVKFVPTDLKETRFNVHLYAYFTDEEGVKKVKENKGVIQK